MKSSNTSAILQKEFLSIAKVQNREKGYIAAEPFNLALDPDLLSLVSRCWAEKYVEQPRIDAIVGLPDAGSRLVSVVADMLRVKKILPSKRTETAPSAWKSVISFSNGSFTTGKEDVISQIGFIEPGMRMLVVDDVVAHGTTAISALKAMQAQGVEIAGLAVIFDKVWQGGVAAIEQETGVPVYSLIRIQEITQNDEIILV